VEVVGGAFSRNRRPEAGDGPARRPRTCENHIDELQLPGGSERKLARIRNEFDPQGATRVKAARWGEKRRRGVSVRSQCSPGQRSAQPLRT